MPAVVTPEEKTQKQSEKPAQIPEKPAVIENKVDPVPVIAAKKQEQANSQQADLDAKKLELIE